VKGRQVEACVCLYWQQRCEGTTGGGECVCIGSRDVKGRQVEESVCLYWQQGCEGTTGGGECVFILAAGM
jgi:hypothetical protein